MNCYTREFQFMTGFYPIKPTFEGAVCQVFGVTSEELRSKQRLIRIVLPRYLMFKHLRSIGWTLQRIGKEFNRDHSTVRTGLIKWEEEYFFNLRYRSLCNLILGQNIKNEKQEIKR